LPRKANKWKLPKIETVAIKSMTIVDKVLMRCLTVDSEDELFAVTDKFTLTHNTATGARGALDATATRRLNLVRNIAENLMKPLFRKWMAYNSEFLDEEEIIRITNEEYVPVRRDDLSGKIDIEITISTAEDNSAKAQELSFLMQTLGNTMPFDMTKMIMSEFARLSRMPALEKQIKEYEPQPDPVQQQIQQLELQNTMLQNEKIKADIADKYARAGENEVDKMLKQAKAELEMAKTRKLHSDADKVDLDFLKDNEGYNDHMKDQEKEKERQHQLMMAQLQATLGGKNEQIGVAR
jgi:hypothetical protein